MAIKKTPKNFDNNLNRRKQHLNEVITEVNTISEKVDGLTGLPKVTAADAGKVLTVSETGVWIPFDAPGGTGDIDWSRELVDEWNFTKSLVSKTGIEFIIEDPTKSNRSANGLISTDGGARVYADLASLGITDWNDIDIELECDTSEFNPYQDKQIFAFYNTGFSNYSLGPKWAGNDGFYGFMSNNHAALYKVNQPKFFDNLCTKIEYDTVNSKDMCTYYGKGVLLTPIVNPVFGTMINEVFQGSNTRLYLGSGYSDWTITGLMMKSLKIYKRTGV